MRSAMYTQYEHYTLEVIRRKKHSDRCSQRSGGVSFKTTQYKENSIEVQRQHFAPD